MLSMRRYQRSGKKLSYEKFSCKKIFIGTTPYCVSVNSAQKKEARREQST